MGEDDERHEGSRMAKPPALSFVGEEEQGSPEFRSITPVWRRSKARSDNRNSAYLEIQEGERCLRLMVLKWERKAGT